MLDVVGREGDGSNSDEMSDWEDADGESDDAGGVCAEARGVLDLTVLFMLHPGEE